MIAQISFFSLQTDWLKINERIEHKIFSVTIKLLQIYIAELLSLYI